LWTFFHFVVVFIEEPHLRTRHGKEYTTYCSRVPRWLGIRRSTAERSHKA
jgi:protein-S-isoprenylcysteine O-methyltransferase Ste14